MNTRVYWRMKISLIPSQKQCAARENLRRCVNGRRIVAHDFVFIRMISAINVRYALNTIDHENAWETQFRSTCLSRCRRCFYRSCDKNILSVRQSFCSLSFLENAIIRSRWDRSNALHFRRASAHLIMRSNGKEDASAYLLLLAGNTIYVRNPHLEMSTSTSIRFRQIWRKPYKRDRHEKCNFTLSRFVIL